ncbi:GNAT family N-acetyltransferase [Cohnella yongneupensis]|uniref:GNAT family N-acetyltransferase n=1 Tax=Cohnella yongneupensis TaxID=425006 RepID=A0ABW0QVL4_9BACL
MAAHTDALQAAIRDNMVQFYVEIGTSNPQVEYVHDDRITLYMTGIPYPMLNRVIETRVTSVPELSDQVRDTANYYRRNDMPAIWLNWSLNEPSELPGLLEAQDFQKIGTMPGMALRLRDLAQERADIPNFEVKQVCDKDDLERYARIVQAAFGFPEVVSQAFQQYFMGVGFGENAPIRHYLGWLDGVPVATVSSFVHDGTVGIYNVATLESARGRGIGGAITLHPLLEAKAIGCEAAILHATPQGYPVYKKIGFQELVQVEMYLMQKGL